MARFSSRYHQSEETTDLQSSVEEFAHQIEKLPFIDGVLVKGQKLRPQALLLNQVKVGHSLGRVATGYIILRNSDNARVYDGIGGLGDATDHIRLRATAETTVTLWVF